MDQTAVAETIPPALHSGLLDRMRIGAGRLRQETAGDRIRRLRRLRDELSRRREELYKAFDEDFRKSPEAVGLSELGPVAWEIDHAIRHLRRWMRPRRVRTPVFMAGTRGEVHQDPKGVALIIAPWNYPVTLTLGPLVSAVAAGCSVVLKPSEHAPAVAAAIARLLEAVFEADEVQVVTGDADASRELLRWRFDHIYFTGSPGVGRLVMRAAAEHLTSVTLELGGKSPTIVDRTADIEATARRIVFGKYSNAGQTCIAPDYVYVHRSVHRELLTALQSELDRQFPEGSRSDGYTRIVSGRHHQRLAAMLADGVERGAGFAAGGQVDDAERTIEPTIVTEPPADASLMKEEIFGPILPVLPFTDVSEAIDAVNAGTPPLAIYLFARSPEVERRLLRETRSGGLVVNDTMIQFANPELPFGGIHESGIGRGHGHFGFLEFTNQRAVVRQHRRHSLASAFYPPTRRWKQSLLRWTLWFYRLR